MSATTDQDPIVLFRQWFAEAETAEPCEADAMTLVSVDQSAKPSARMVLLKGVDERGFVFYTNMKSRKASDILTNPYVALCFYWKSLHRQVRIEGTAHQVTDAEADAYFASRPRLSKIGAWASRQSQHLEGRFALEKRVAEFSARFNIGEVPRPPFWSGFRVIPESIEFWQQRQFRLHERILYSHYADGWETERLYP